jgi:hypothetical protein
LISLNRSLEQHIRLLHLDVRRIRARIREMEGHNIPWAPKYARRMALLANLLLAVVLWWQRFVESLREARPRLIQAVVMSRGGGGSSGLGGLLGRAALQGFSSSWIYFLGASLISLKSHQPLVLSGMLITSSRSVWLALTGPESRWPTLLSNGFALLVYLYYMYLSPPTVDDPFLRDLL